jgi:acyl phosphate:glycerol-3-phosphate acyltransferase
MLLTFFLALVCGSVPTSVWLGRLLLGRDVRRYGDGNPGATNVFRSGSKAVGLLVLLIDVSKAAAPVGWAYNSLGYRGTGMVAIALAPILGHVFSPWLGFRGGKGVATVLGVWIGLTLWRVSLPAVLLVVFWFALVDSAGWAVMLTLIALLGGLLAWARNSMLLAVLVGQIVILGWTHRNDLGRWPRWRSWLKRRPN